MRMIKIGLAAVLGAVISGVNMGAGWGQTPQSLPDPEANIVEELVVTARHPAPAWWRVENGASTVYILGVLDIPLPKDVAWRRQELDARLDGARGLIVAPRLHAGLEDIFGLFK